MSISEHPSRKIIEYGIYISVLLLCIVGIYWRFWYRPKVEPVVMINPAGFVAKGQAMPSPLLDPNFSWSLVRIVPQPPEAIFKQDDTGKSLALKIDEEIEGWKIKSIEKTMVIIVNSNGDERALYYSGNSPGH